MSNHPSNNTATEEIDLGYLIKKINQIIKKAARLFFDYISFLLKYKIIIGLVLILAIGYGYYKDKNAMPVYNNEAIVIPNFESVDYLYDKIEALHLKAKTRDTVFLKEVLGNDYWRFKGAEAEPIIDIFKFAARTRENIDVLRILYQNQEYTDFSENPFTSKNFKYHRVNFKILGEENSERVVQKLFSYLNSNNHFSDYSEIYKENILFQAQEHKKMIAQIDDLITSMTREDNSSRQGVYVYENNSLHFLVEKKRTLLDDLLSVEMRSSDYDHTIKLVNIDYNLKNVSFLTSKTKQPILVFLLITLLFFVLKGYAVLKKIAYEDKD